MSDSYGSSGNDKAAETLVFDNLGMDAADLGVEADQVEADIGTEETGDEGQVNDLSMREEAPRDRGERQEQRPREGRDQFGRRDRRAEPPAQPTYQPFKQDNKGNLIDAQTGRLVARSGREARMYQDAFTARTQLNKVTQQAQGQIRDTESRLNRAVEIGRQAFTELETYRARDKQLQGLGLQPTEQLEAMRLAAQAKSDPVGALKVLLTRAAARGIDLTQLGLNAGGDPKALMDMLRGEIGQQMQPLKERQQAEQRQQEQNAAQAETVRNVESFFNQNPEARQYMQVFHKIYSEPNLAHLSLGEVWARIQLGIANRRGATQQPQNRSQGSQRRAPINGRSAPSQGNSSMAPVNQSYEAIVRDLLSETGDIQRV